MNQISHRRLTAFLAVGTLAFTAMPARADHAWANYHWERSSNPATIELGDNVDSVWDSEPPRFLRRLRYLSPAPVAGISWL